MQMVLCNLETKQILGMGMAELVVHQLAVLLVRYWSAVRIPAKESKKCTFLLLSWSSREAGRLLTREEYKHGSLIFVVPESTYVQDLKK
jgi:hypothetical protein